MRSESCEIAALDALADRFQIRREGAVAVPERHVGADQRHRRRKRRRRRERPAQIDALRRGEQFDRDDARGVRRHRRQPSRGERRHADMILLIRGGRQRVDRGRVRERLVLRRERRRRHLRDHEAGIHAAVLDQERRQAGQVGVHHQRDAPLGQRADLGDREREIVRGEGDGLGVEIAAGENFAGLREHERIVRDRVRLGHEDRGRMAHLVEAGAHHLRLAAQAVGILHARAILVRRADRAAVEQAR